MKGRDTFTSDEVVAIRKLLREKAKADGAGQKSVRSKLRKLGFYISDFAFGEAGFEVADFDRLVANGTIKEQHAALREPECKALAPERIILIKATVYDAAYRPLRVAGLPVIDKRVFFPSTGRQEDFRRQFGEALRAKP